MEESAENDSEMSLPAAASRSALVEIRMVNIHFPFEPYDLQKDYMSAVIECLQKKFNGLLESPTGTGKTLSLLCSSLAWLEDRKAAIQLQGAGTDFPQLRQAETSGQSSSFDVYPQVLYSSRTHSQLSQASRELKRTKYKYMNSVVLGSRDQLCINCEVNNLPTSTQKIRKCQILVNSRACEYYQNYETKVSHEDYSAKHVVDIEDLVSLGKKHRCCPYYATKILRKKADVVFVPYNYIVDPSTRRAQGLGLENNVVIFDEAHNIESFCEDSLSFSITSTDLAGCIKELDGIGQAMVNSEEGDNLDFEVAELSVLKSMLCELETKFDEASATGKHYDGDFIVTLLKQTEIDGQHEKIMGLLDSILKYVQSMSSQGLWGPKGVGLQKVLDMLTTVYSGGSQIELKESFKLFFEQPKEAQREVFVVEKKKKKWDLHFVCLAPGVRMKSIVQAGVHSVILTSGTLSPMGTLATELGVPFQVQLSNDHIITPDKIKVLCVPQGPDRADLISTYQNRSNEKYIRSLGLTLNEMCRRIPHGVLVFFPSFPCMKSLVDKWNDMGIMRRLRDCKVVLQEEPGSSSFNSTIQCYKDAVVNNAQGAMLFAVCRGKSSEGVDFSDEFARAVVIVGIPYAPRQDNRVLLKIEYLNKHGTNGMNGNSWYQIQAIRAINQAIGRVIRHRNDYGVILFADKRFAEIGVVNQLSKWVKDRVETTREFRKAIVGVSTFFQAHNACVSIRSTVFAAGKAAFVNSGQKLPGTSNKLISTSQVATVNVNKEIDKQSQKLVEFYKASTSLDLDDGRIKEGRSALEAVEEYSARQTKQQQIDALPTLTELKKRPAASIKEEPKRRKLNVPLHDILGSQSSGDLAVNDAEKSSNDATSGESSTAVVRTNDDVLKDDRRRNAMEMIHLMVKEMRKCCGSSTDVKPRFANLVVSFRATRCLSSFCETLSTILVDHHAKLSTDLLITVSQLFPCRQKCLFGLEMIRRIGLNGTDSVESKTLKKLSDNLLKVTSHQISVHVIRWALKAATTEGIEKYFYLNPPPGISTEEFEQLYQMPIPSNEGISAKMKEKIPGEDWVYFVRALKNFVVKKDLRILSDDDYFRRKFRDHYDIILPLFNVQHYVDFFLAMHR